MLATQSTVKAFYTWSHGGLEYVAFPCGSGVFVVDALSRGYGLFESVALFRNLQREGNDFAAPLPGCAYQIVASVKHA